MLDRLEKHHIGIVIDPSQVPEFESKFFGKFHRDETQGVQVYFRWNEAMKLYEEYFTKEGRAQKYNLGLHHICYNVENDQAMEKIHEYLLSNKLGFRLTFLEKSGSVECGKVCFYQIKNSGIVEFNIKKLNESENYSQGPS